MPGTVPLFRDNYSIPGMTAAVETFENEFLLSGFPYKDDAGCILDGDSTDAGNTNFTSVLRKGLLMSLDRATNEWKPWAPFTQNAAAAANYAQSIDGILSVTIDVSGGSTNRIVPITRIGRVMADRLVIPGTEAIGLAGHALRYLIGRQLAPNLLLDDPTYSLSNCLAYFDDDLTAGDVNLLNYPNGTTFVFSGGNGITQPLPAALPGLQFTFVSRGDQDVVLTAPADNSIYSMNETGNTLTLSDEGDCITLVGVQTAADTYVWLATNVTPASDTAGSVAIAQV